MSIINDNDINKILIDNITKENISTYINKYISDTIFILQFQINSCLTNNIISNSSKFYQMEDINDKISLIKKINNSLEKELFCLNNTKIKDISKLFQALSMRNELLNKLMSYFFNKLKVIENKESFLNDRIKNCIKGCDDNFMKLEKFYFKKKESPKINLYIENIKKNNQYNFRKISSTNFDSERNYNRVYFYNNKEKKNRKAFKIIEDNKSIIKKNKMNLNTSYDTIYNSNSLAIINMETININDKDNISDLNKNNFNGNQKLKKRKINSVVKTINSDILFNKYDYNNKTKFNIKNIYRLNKLNLEKLNNISSSILLVDNKNL